MSSVQVMCRCNWIAPCGRAGGPGTALSLRHVTPYLPKVSDGYILPLFREGQSLNMGAMATLLRASIGTMGT